MQKTGTTGRMINTVCVLLLFCVFAATVLITLLSGANAYQSVNDNMQSQYTERTCLAYLEAKLHHYDQVGSVALESFDGVTALVLSEQIEGTQYKTLVYYHDGYVRELFFEDGMDFQLQDGGSVLAAQSLDFQWKQPNLLQLTCASDDGAQSQLLVYLHGGEEVALYA